MLVSAEPTPPRPQVLVLALVLILVLALAPALRSGFQPPCPGPFLGLSSPRGPGISAVRLPVRRTSDHVIATRPLTSLENGTPPPLWTRTGTGTGTRAGREGAVLLLGEAPCPSLCSGRPVLWFASSGACHRVSQWSSSRTDDAIPMRQNHEPSPAASVTEHPPRRSHIASHHGTPIGDIGTRTMEGRVCIRASPRIASHRLERGASCRPWGVQPSLAAVLHCFRSSAVLLTLPPPRAMTARAEMSLRSRWPDVRASASASAIATVGQSAAVPGPPLFSTPHTPYRSTVASCPSPLPPPSPLL